MQNQNNKNNISDTDIKLHICTSIAIAYDKAVKQQQDNNIDTSGLFSKILISQLAISISSIIHSAQIDIEKLKAMKEQLVTEFNSSKEMLEMLKKKYDNKIIILMFSDRMHKDIKGVVDILLGAKLEILLQEWLANQGDAIANLYASIDHIKNQDLSCDQTCLGVKLLNAWINNEVNASEEQNVDSANNKEDDQFSIKNLYAPIDHIKNQDLSCNQARLGVAWTSNQVNASEEQNDIANNQKNHQSSRRVTLFKSLYDLIANFCKEIGRYFYQANEATKTSESTPNSLASEATKTSESAPNDLASEATKRLKSHTDFINSIGNKVKGCIMSI